jgi:hypothetical protein
MAVLLGFCQIASSAPARHAMIDLCSGGHADATYRIYQTVRSWFDQVAATALPAM